METPNVNNLNGVPNFGLGFQENNQGASTVGEGDGVIPTEAQEPSVDEDDSTTETEVKDQKHGKSKRKS